MGFKTRKQSLMHNTFLPLNVIQNGSLTVLLLNGCIELTWTGQWHTFLELLYSRISYNLYCIKRYVNKGDLTIHSLAYDWCGDMEGKTSIFHFKRWKTNLLQYFLKRLTWKIRWLNVLKQPFIFYSNGIVRTLWMHW